MKALRIISLLIGCMGVLAAALPDEPTGNITGTVAHSSVKRYPTIVYVEEIPGRQFSPPAKTAVMDQKGKEFVPHVLPVLVGSTVDFLNSDSFEHNVFSPDGEEYDLGKWGKGGKRSYTFKEPGVYTQLCHVHPEMVGYIIVLKTPYFGMVDQSGRFEILNVPEGKYSLKVWNERLRPSRLKKSFPVEVKADQAVQVEIAF